MHVSGRIYFSDIRVSGRSIRENPDVELTVPVDSLSTLRLSYPQNSFIVGTSFGECQRFFSLLVEAGGAG